ncbi:MAG: FkbM family methyltransferase [Sphingobacteriales bacterium]|jgi:FkbM family methyltransferase|nr:FkbM family methyltransferase [Sphingobacteriales bacterium]MBP9141403.1 FkbM family methyltransferase [Chitinophagales bacterium]MDA0197553.1 FkbM family methyltransferase [Bacteroidota bacterium]MBK6890561.1 FkbM family methyltransferase [Sphingobacteriales bacterium]MBK7526388.1 FkbM family methyltransferase [Sphingobacteriales bacterium]
MRLPFFIRKIAREIALQIAPKWYKHRLLAFIRQVSWHNLNTINRNLTDFEPELLLLPYLLQPTLSFIDIGCHKGEYLYAAQYYAKHPENLLLGFEPIPSLNRLLTRFFPKAIISPVAISNKNGEFLLKIPQINKQWRLARATLNTHYLETNEENSQKLTVKTQRLDDFLAQNKAAIAPPCLLKIDTEGHEWEVIEGAQQTIALYHPALIVEVEQRHHNQPITQIIDAICELGYNCYYYQPVAGQMVPFSATQANALQTANPKTDRQAYINNFLFLPTNTDQQIISNINTQIANSTC